MYAICLAITRNKVKLRLDSWNEAIEGEELSVKVEDVFMDLPVLSS